MALGFLNFGDDTLGALPSYLTVDALGGTATVTVETLSGSLSGQALRIARSASNVIRMVRVNTADDFDYGEVTALVRIDGAFAAAGVWGRINDAQVGDPTGFGYTAYNSTGSLYRYENANTTVSTAMAGTSHTFGVASYTTGPKRVWMRFRWADAGGGNTTLQMKAWDVDAEAEPGAWDLDTSVGATSVTGPGKPGIWTNLQGGGFGNTLWVEALGWSTDPDVSSPLEPVSAGGGSSPGPGGSREFFPGSRGAGFIFNKLR